MLPQPYARHPASVPNKQERAVHDYTSQLIHEERMVRYLREADASRLASEARQGRPSEALPARIRSLGQAFARWTERRTDRGRSTSSPSLQGREAAKITPAVSGSRRGRYSFARRP